MKREILDYTVCPSCTGMLIFNKIDSQTGLDIITGALMCTKCKRTYEITDGIPVLKVGKQEAIAMDYQKHAADFDKEWEKFGSVKSQEELDGRKTNPELTKNSTKMQLSTLYEYCYSQKSKILDVGCGLGFDLKRIKERFEDCVLFGIDVSEIAINQAQRNGAPGFLCVAFAESLPFTENFFDIIISHEVLEHVVDPSSCLAEMGRVLKENGRITISTPNGKGLFSAFIEPAKLELKKILGRNVTKRYKDSPLAISKIKEICDHYGLWIEKVLYTCPFYFLGNLITEHMPVSISKMITKLIVRYSDQLARIPSINALICDEMTIIIEKAK